MSTRRSARHASKKRLAKITQLRTAASKSDFTIDFEGKIGPTTKLERFDQIDPNAKVTFDPRLKKTYDLTHQVFFNSKCQLKDEDDEHSVVAIKDIKAGELLLVEHCYYSDLGRFKLLATCLHFQRELFNEFAPRTIPWDPSWGHRSSTTAPTEVRELILEKLKRNVMLNAAKDKVTMGRIINWFNHIGRPNSIIWTRSALNDGIIPMDSHFMTVTAGCDIKAGEEIILKHDEFDPLDPTQIPDPMMARADPTTSQELVRRIIEQYGETTQFRRITLNQIKNKFGLYAIDDVILPSSRLLHFLGTDEKSDFRKAINDWIEEMNIRINSFRI